MTYLDMPMTVLWLRTGEPYALALMFGDESEGDDAP